MTTGSWRILTTYRFAALATSACAAGARKERLKKPCHCPSIGVPGTVDAQLAEVISTEGTSLIRFDAAADASAVTWQVSPVTAVGITSAIRQSIVGDVRWRRVYKLRIVI